MVERAATYKLSDICLKYDATLDVDEATTITEFYIKTKIPYTKVT